MHFLVLTSLSFDTFVYLQQKVIMDIDNYSNFTYLLLLLDSELSTSFNTCDL